jgi:hypothetical protein
VGSAHARGAIQRRTPTAADDAKAGMRRVTWVWLPLIGAAGAVAAVVGEPDSDLRAGGLSVLLLSAVIAVALVRGGALLRRSLDEQAALDGARGVPDAFASWEVSPRAWWHWVRSVRGDAKTLRAADLVMMGVAPLVVFVALAAGDAGAGWALVATAAVTAMIAGAVWLARRKQQRDLDRLQRATPRVVLTPHALHVGDNAVPWHFGRGLPPMGRGRVERFEWIEGTPSHFAVRLHYPLARGQRVSDITVPAPEDPRKAEEILQDMRGRIVP